MVTRADFAASVSATRLNVENSWVAFDMLIETSTIVPSSDGLPWASSGRMRASWASAALRCPSGGTLRPCPYNPPSSPL